MPTTITITERTRQRLADYKRGDSTFDDVLNALMDRVQLEDVAAEQVVEHYRRLGSFRGEPAQRFVRRVRRLKAAARDSK